MSLFRRLRLPAKFTFVEKLIGQRPFRLLDIGAGNYSASKTLRWFPNCEYHGVDLNRDYNNDERDFQLMRAFYEMNLEALDFAAIPDGYFDFIMMAHIIEHLRNGDAVVQGLLSKLRPGGVIYVEFPGPHSTTLPRMQGTLNFFDDDTHVRIYSRPELYNLLMRNGMQVVGGGVWRRWQNIALIPLKVPHNLLKYRRILPSIFWDLFGFAEYVAARKPA